VRIWILNVLVSDHPQRDADIGYFSSKELADAAQASIPTQLSLVREVEVDRPLDKRWL
jgi:hypothetical protein